MTIDKPLLGLVGAVVAAPVGIALIPVQRPAPDFSHVRTMDTV